MPSGGSQAHIVQWLLCARHPSVWSAAVLLPEWLLHAGFCGSFFSNIPTLSSEMYVRMWCAVGW